MQLIDLGLMPYRDAWIRQELHHADVVAGGEEAVLLVEHPPVITLGRRSAINGIGPNLLASEQLLAERGVELVQSDRGGDITFHGPGQLVVYPIVRLNTHKLSVGAYVQILLDAVVETLAEFGIQAGKDRQAIGVWVGQGATAAKLCALGVRVRRGVTLHGIALNVSTDLRYFDLIVPCGLPSRRVTSMNKLLDPNTMNINGVKPVLTQKLFDRLAAKC